MSFLLLLALGSSRADEEYEFWSACEAGDIATMRRLVASGADLEYHDDDGRTPLLLTVLGSHSEAALFLAKSGADLEATGRWPGPEEGPLAVAAGRGDLRLMDALLSAGASPLAVTGPDGSTPLVAAAANGKTEAVRTLLGVGAPVDARRRDGTTAASWAARNGHASAFGVLLDHGARLDARDEVDGSTPLHFAAQAPTGEAVRVALAAGADLSARTNVMAPKDEDRPKRQDLRGGATPLMTAAAAASVEAIDALLAHARRTLSTAGVEAYVNAVDAAGLTALAWACSVPNGARTTETLETLAAAGARHDSITVDGRALVHVAAHGRNARALAWLVDVEGHDVDARSPGRGLTPLTISAFQGSRAAAKALLRRGADVNAVAPDGATPLIAAASAAQKGVASLLLKKGADPLRRLRSGEFPSQVTPKSPHGKLLKWSLSKAERKAWRRLEREAQRRIEERGGSAPPEQEDGVDDAEVEDLEEGGDDEEEAPAAASPENDEL
ncbi:hypothetical protein CTAYLR_003373 [Chrysophaeum taylorii]|uniref:Uncharacterized protein n=1 Tax=Chrysophaeum taylorii TaxID=2483200 RepID=A0AAD7UEW1_9STRA|nr:hypothetical protein CTAYLR_003373 [Chrysophaeum taylorii]